MGNPRDLEYRTGAASPLADRRPRVSGSRRGWIVGARPTGGDRDLLRFDRQILALVDALLRERALSGIRIEAPELIRLFKDRAGDVRIRIHNPSRKHKRLRIGIRHP